MLADASGLHPAEIEALERGAGDPQMTSLMNLARALEVPVAALLDGIA